MASRVEVFDLTVPAGTAIATPVTLPTSMDDGVVQRLEMRWPPGPSGLVGLRLRHSQQVVIPYSVNAWIISDSEPIYWDLQGYPTGNAWDFLGYNLGVYPHTIQVRFLLDEIAMKPQTTQLIAI